MEHHFCLLKGLSKKSQKSSSPSSAGTSIGGFAGEADCTSLISSSFSALLSAVVSFLARFGLLVGFFGFGVSLGRTSFGSNSSDGFQFAERKRIRERIRINPASYPGTGTLACAHPSWGWAADVHRLRHLTAQDSISAMFFTHVSLRFEVAAARWSMKRLLLLMHTVRKWFWAPWLNNIPFSARAQCPGTGTKSGRGLRKPLAPKVVPGAHNWWILQSIKIDTSWNQSVTINLFTLVPVPISAKPGLQVPGCGLKEEPRSNKKREGKKTSGCPWQLIDLTASIDLN